MSKAEISKDKAPIIGLTGMRWPDGNKNDMFIMDKTQVHYIEAVQKSGGIPIILPVLEIFDAETVKRQVSLVDAILIQGGIDITPSFYGEEPLPELDITCKKTDEFILEVLNTSIDYININCSLEGLDKFPYVYIEDGKFLWDI